MGNDAEAPLRDPGPAPPVGSDPTAKRPDHSVAGRESGSPEPPRWDDQGSTGATPILRERRTAKGTPRYVWGLGALAILLLASVAALMSVDNQSDYVRVKSAVTSPEKYLDQRIQVYGNVQDWNPTGSENRFILNDTRSTRAEFYLLEINATGVPIPSAFGENKGATITGKLYYDAGELKFKATEMRVGCPSKYEGEENP